MKTFLNLLDYNYDKYVLVACIIGMFAVIAYSIFKSSPTTGKFWKTLTILTALGAFVYIGIGAISYLNSGVTTLSEIKYKEQNDSLLKVKTYLEVENDSLRKIISSEKIKKIKSDERLKEYQNILNETKLQYNEKIANIDLSNSDDIDGFFSKYPTRYYEIYNIGQ